MKLMITAPYAHKFVRWMMPNIYNKAGAFGFFDLAQQNKAYMLIYNIVPSDILVFRPDNQMLLGSPFSFCKTFIFQDLFCSFSLPFFEFKGLGWSRDKKSCDDQKYSHWYKFPFYNFWSKLDRLSLSLSMPSLVFHGGAE